MVPSKFSRLVDIREFRVNGKEIANLRCKFDVLGLQVYDTEKNEYVLDILPPKANLEFHFKVGVVVFPHNGEEMAVEGSLPLWLPLGEMKEQDMEVGNLGRAQLLLNDWLKEVGVDEESELWKATQVTQLPLISALFCPGLKLENAPEILLLSLLCLTFRESFEKFKVSGLSFEELTAAVSTFCAICLGDSYNAEHEAQTLFPNFKIVCLLCTKFRGMLLDLRIDRCSEVLKDFVEYIEAHAWELNQCWMECSHKTRPKKFFFYRKELTYGLKMYIELLCVYRNVIVPSKSRRDPLFTLLKNQWVRMGILATDIFSLGKCIEDKNEDNSLYLRAKKMGATAAMDKTVRDIQACVRNARSFEAQLKVKFDGTPDFTALCQYFEVGKTMVDADFQYLITSEVYGEFEVRVEVNISENSTVLAKSKYTPTGRIYFLNF